MKGNSALDQMPALSGISVPQIHNLGSTALTKDQRIFPFELGLGGFGRTSKADTRVSQETSMQISSFWACVQRTAEVVSTMPVHGFEKNSSGYEDQFEDELTNVIGTSPNSDQTAPEYWEGMVANMLVNGNAYSEKLGSRTRLVGLERPLDPHKVRPFRNEDGDLIYQITDRGQVEEMPADKVFHLKGFGFGGDTGLSVIKYGTETFGTAIAAEENSARMFSEGLNTSGFLTSEQLLDAKQRAQVQGMMEMFTGSKRSGKMMVLEAGLKYHAISMNPEDAQLLDTRKFSIEEICRWFGIPPIIIGHSPEGQTMWGTGVESIMLSWLTTGLNPLLRKIETRILKSLVPAMGRRRKKYKFTRETIVQMDIAAKTDHLTKMVQGGLMTPNEARQKLNLPPLPGGDVLIVQQQMVPLDTIGKKEVPNA